MAASSDRKGDSPFRGLKALLAEKSVSLPAAPAKDPGPAPELRKALEAAENCRLSDRELFLRAMAGVTPLKSNLRRKPRPSANPQPEGGEDLAAEADDLAALAELVRSGKGFTVSGTPEYMEGIGACAHPEITRRLHRGDFAIQHFIDLHGLTVAQAAEAFDSFMRTAVRSGLRGVLVVHGRGLSSPGRPVLKRKVNRWLSSGPWRKWVIAFASARSCDGGAGATYVLLRRRPLPKRHRRRSRQRPP
ncbi:MAG: Smr/MutS family protein [Desulfobacteraceae bacterium]|jgi:DNA-nicking Smr family endonuclease